MEDLVVEDARKTDPEPSQAIQAKSPLFSLHSHRLRICLLMAVAIFVVSSNRMSMSVGIVCMVNSTVSYTSEHSNASTTSIKACQRQESSEEEETKSMGELFWSPPQQTLLLASASYGSLTMIAFSGLMADSFGPSKLLAVVLATSAAMTLLVPTLARTNYWVLLVSRVVIGMGEASLMPSTNCMAARWFPKTEKTTLAALYTSGFQLAAGFGSLLAAELCRAEALGGWQSIFYVFGGFAAIFTGIFLIFAKGKPRENRWTSPQEKAFLEAAIPTNFKRPSFLKAPWKAIITSKPLHSVMLCSFAFSYSINIMQGFLPLFLKESFSLPVRTIGHYVLVCFVMQIIGKSFLGPMTDYFAKHGYLSLTTSTKVSQAFGSFGASICSLLIAFLPSCDHPEYALYILIGFGAVNAGAVCGYYTSILTIAPRYTGTISAICSICGVLAASSASTLVSALTKINTPYKWPLIFGSAAFFQSISGLHYLLFGTTNELEWSKASSESSDKVADLPRKSELTSNDLITSKA